MSKEENNGVLTPEEVREQEELKKETSLEFTAKGESGGSEFMPLEDDVFYRLVVDKVEVRNRPKYDDPSVIEKIIMLTFTVDGRDDGKDIKDIEDNVQEDGVRKFWEFLSTTATGFTSAGEPSKTRACICALLDKDPEDTFALNDVDSLVGKSCKGMFSLVKKQDGTVKNKCIRYKSL
jgi:hypothetical protein